MNALVELRQKVQIANDVRTHSQRFGWICATTSPFFLGEEVALTCEDESQILDGLVADEFDIDAGWIDGFEFSIAETLVALGVFDPNSQIAVFEVVIHGRNGPLLRNRRGRFLVMRIGHPHVLYACDSIAVAYGLARSLSESEAEPQIDESRVRKLRVPRNRFGFGLRPA